MILTDFHVHTDFCDGKNTPEEVAESAYAQGMSRLGLLTHSYTAFDQSYCIKKERMGEFRERVARIKEQYKGKMEILCGVEQDIYSEESTEGFDYVIGSVHYLKCGDEYFPIDESEESLVKTVNDRFGGDFYAMADAYFTAEARVAELTHPNIIGHFDLVTKFNEGGKLFSESDERYAASAKRALDSLLPYKIPFEVNTGAISRGYRSQPYPSKELSEYIKSNGGKLLMSSDSHRMDTLCFLFDKWSCLL